MVGKGRSPNVKPKFKPGGGKQKGKGKGKPRSQQQGKVTKKPKFARPDVRPMTTKKPFVSPKPPAHLGQPAHIAKKMKLNRAKQQQQPKTNARVPYTEEQRILIVGEGNFSFTRALCDLLGGGKNLVASTLDDEATMKAKYGDARKDAEEPGAVEETSEVLEIVRSVKADYGVEVIYGMDVTKMAAKFDRFLDHFDRIVFNFPHAGETFTCDFCIIIIIIIIIDDLAWDWHG